MAEDRSWTMPARVPRVASRASCRILYLALGPPALDTAERVHRTLSTASRVETVRRVTAGPGDTSQLRAQCFPGGSPPLRLVFITTLNPKKLKLKDVNRSAQMTAPSDSDASVPPASTF